MPEKNVAEKPTEKPGKTPSREKARTKRAGKFMRDEMDQVRAKANTVRDLLTKAVEIGLAKARIAGAELPSRLASRSKTKTRSRKTQPSKTQAKKTAKASSRPAKRAPKSKAGPTASMPRMSRRQTGPKAMASAKGGARSRKSGSSRPRSSGRSPRSGG